MTPSYLTPAEIAGLRKFQTPLTRTSKNFNPIMFDLLSMGYGSGDEAAVTEYIIKVLAKFHIPKERVLKDFKGNLWVTIGDNSTTLFSTHVDTVHSGKQIITPVIVQGCGDVEFDGMVFGTKVLYPVEWAVVQGPPELTNLGWKAATDLDAEIKKLHDHTGSVVYHAIDKTNVETNYVIHLKRWPADIQKIELEGVIVKRRLNLATPKLEPSILGADDKVGVWILLQLIHAGTPGTYIFHVGEECGAIGSGWIAKNKTADIEKFKRAIAFDRRNYTHVIGYQRGSRCASTEFTKELASRLTLEVGAPKLAFEADVTGSFTDTASYAKLIPECTNISAGYFNEHSISEHFDWYWVSGLLLPALKKINWETLPVVRDPKAVPKSTYTGSSYYGDRSRDRYGESHYNGYNMDEYDPTHDYRYDEGYYSTDPSARRREVVMGPSSEIVDKAKKRITVETSVPALIMFEAATQDEFWMKQKMIPPWKLTPETPEISVPWWKPEYGLYPQTAPKMMLRIIKKHLEEMEDPLMCVSIPEDQNTPEKLILRLVEYLSSQQKIIESLER